MVSEVEAQRFIASGSGYGNGNGNGDGNGDGSGNGYGSGDGSGNGYGSGYGYGYGNGDGSGNGYGSGYGSGNGYGYGSGNGDGSGYGYGYGYGNGNGIKEMAGCSLYQVDGVPTAFESIHGNYAKGYTVRYNTVFVPCFIAKVNGYFGHGETLHDAVKAATDKYMENRPLDERIDEFVKAHPDYDKAYDDLFDWHHILTGSCEFGRKQWCENHGLTPESALTIRQFCEMTLNDYGGDAIRQLKEKYAIQ